MIDAPERGMVTVGNGWGAERLRAESHEPRETHQQQQYHWASWITTGTPEGQKKHAVKVKVKVTWIYMAPSRETSKALRHGSHSFTCKLHHACLYRVSVHQMALPLTCDNVRLAAYYSSKDERLSWPNWLTYSRRFTHITRQPLLSCGVRPSVRLSVRHVRESCQNE